MKNFLSCCLFIILIALFGCKKKTYCYVCTVKAYGTSSTTVKSTTTVCDKTPSEIQEYEKAGSIITKVGNTTTSVITTCSQQ